MPYAPISKISPSKPAPSARHISDTQQTKQAGRAVRTPCALCCSWHMGFVVGSVISLLSEHYGRGNTVLASIKKQNQKQIYYTQSLVPQYFANMPITYVPYGLCH